MISPGCPYASRLRREPADMGQPRRSAVIGHDEPPVKPIGSTPPLVKDARRGIHDEPQQVRGVARLNRSGTRVAGRGAGGHGEGEGCGEQRQGDESVDSGETGVRAGCPYFRRAVHTIAALRGW